MKTASACVGSLPNPWNPTHIYSTAIQGQGQAAANGLGRDMSSVSQGDALCQQHHPPLRSAK
eukprot:2505253-Pyramimonas_sp.AAC.1